MEYKLKHNEDMIALSVKSDGEARFTAVIGETSFDVAYRRISNHEIHLTVDGRQVAAFVADTPDGTAVMVKGRAWLLQEAPARGARPGKGLKGGPLTVSPPMPAVVTKILVAEGETVEKGQGVVVVSAMKMDTTLAAPFDGVVARINVAEGDKVTPKQVLVDITPVPANESAEP